MQKEVFFSGLHPEHFRCTYGIAIASFIARLGFLGAFEHETGPSGARVQSRVHRGKGKVHPLRAQKIAIG